VRHLQVHDALDKRRIGGSDQLLEHGREEQSGVLAHGVDSALFDGAGRDGKAVLRAAGIGQQSAQLRAGGHLAVPDPVPAPLSWLYRLIGAGRQIFQQHVAVAVLEGEYALQLVPRRRRHLRLGHQAAPRDIARVARHQAGQKLRPHRRRGAVGTDQQVPGGFASARKTGCDTAAVLLEPDQLFAGVHKRRGQPPLQRPVQQVPRRLRLRRVGALHHIASPVQEYPVAGGHAHGAGAQAGKLDSSQHIRLKHHAAAAATQLAR
jgi:hypothetical protein